MKAPKSGVQFVKMDDKQIWPADPAPSAENTSAPEQSAHGTGQAPGSGQEGLILSALRQIVDSLSVLIEQNETIIAVMLDEPEQGEDEVPTRYLSGQRIS